MAVAMATNQIRARKAVMIEPTTLAMFGGQALRHLRDDFLLIAVIIAFRKGTLMFL